MVARYEKFGPVDTVVKSDAMHSRASREHDSRALPVCSRSSPLFLAVSHSHLLRLREEPLEPVQPHQVLLQFLAAPINPADLNMIEGVSGCSSGDSMRAGNAAGKA